MSGAHTPDLLQNLSQRLGISDRHLRRIFEAHLGVSPAQYLLTQRLLNAKRLLADTSIKIAEVAAGSGFGSVRQFNNAFVTRYGMRPGDMRRQQRSSPGPSNTTPVGAETRLFWRPPVAIDRLMGFLQDRAVAGVEEVMQTDQGWTIWRSLTVNGLTGQQRGWIRVQVPRGSCEVRLMVSDGLQARLPEVTWRVRNWLDIDADPAAIDSTLGADFVQAAAGLRLPGAIDGFELGVRAVIGQQVSVKAARTVLGRLCEALGQPIETPHSSVHLGFPTPKDIGNADSEVLGRLGLTRQKQTALKALAQAVLSDQLDISPSADAALTHQLLVSLPGIGPWTAGYIVMRGLHWPDVWLEGDLVLRQALRSADEMKTGEQPADAARWAPWRSYAVMATWSGLLKTEMKQECQT
ncbi:DNA-3-methyladenine glycosylase 2 [Hydrogenophaga sp. 5NK40-0174]